MSFNPWPIGGLLHRDGPFPFGSSWWKELFARIRVYICQCIYSKIQLCVLKTWSRAIPDRNLTTPCSYTQPSDTNKIANGIKVYVLHRHQRGGGPGALAQRHVCGPEAQRGPENHWRKGVAYAEAEQNDGLYKLLFQRQMLCLEKHRKRLKTKHVWCVFAI